MNQQYILKEEHWQRIKDYLPGSRHEAGKTGCDNRRFLEAVIWIANSGGPWRELPPEFGNWPSVHRRFIRWRELGLWQTIFNTLSVNKDTEWLLIDPSIAQVGRRSRSRKRGRRKPVDDGMEGFGQTG